MMSNNLEQAIVCVIGLGYVGLPLAEAFAQNRKVIGFDVEGNKIKNLAQNNQNPNLTFTDNPEEISAADFIHICVPTPVTRAKEPDLSYVISAAETAGKNIKKGATVILESTVYPGTTEEIIGPIVERESGLKCGRDFKIAYSPERINPGDKEHGIERIPKVVAGIDQETTEMVARLYGQIAASIYKAKDIKTAEAAKVIENIQRDINIALVNELAIIFKSMGLSTRDILDTAATKWNFNRYSPGLVGGHCIPVDPYYLVYKARELGYHPQVILAGRAINDHMPKYVANMAIKALNEAGKVIKDCRVLILGLTYKEDVPDTRESPVKGIIKELMEYGMEVIGFDPLLNGEDFKKQFGIRLLKDLSELKERKADCAIFCVAHSLFREIKLNDLKKLLTHHPVLIDVRGTFDGDEARKAGFYYKEL